MPKISFATIPVGLFLLASAMLKYWHFLASGSEMTPAWLDPVIVLYEAALGLGLMFANRPAGLWLVAVVTFSIFVMLNLYGILVGQASCGCFGSIAVSPWNALVLDVLALALLAAWAWRDRTTIAIRASVPDVVGFLVGFSIVVAVLLSAVSVGAGSIAGLRATLRGDDVFLGSSVVDFGEIQRGETSESSITVINASSTELRVVGGSATCACTLIPSLPATIPPGESRELQVRVKAPASSGVFRLAATLWTDSPKNQSISVMLRGRSVGP